MLLSELSDSTSDSESVSDSEGEKDPDSSESSSLSLIDDRRLLLLEDLLDLDFDRARDAALTFDWERPLLVSASSRLERDLSLRRRSLLDGICGGLNSIGGSSLGAGRCDFFEPFLLRTFGLEFFPMVFCEEGIVTPLKGGDC